MRRGMIVVVLLVLLAASQLVATAEAVTSRPIVYGKTQWEWPGEGRPQREWGGLFAAGQGEPRQLTDHPGDKEPNVSPSGKEIVFVRDGDVYVMNADGSGQRRLTSGPDLDERPQVAPQGTFVLFTRRSAFGDPRNLFAVHLGGGDAWQLTSGPEDDFEASFSPGGRLIVFVRGLPGPAGGEFSGNAELYSIRPSSEGLTRLTHTPQDELRPRYTARGIVFQRRNRIRSPLSLFSMRRDGSGVMILVRRKGNSSVGAVSPNGRLLLFNGNGLWRKRLLPSGRWSRARRVDSAGRGSLVFSPDGCKVAGTFANNSSEVAPFYVLSWIDVIAGVGGGAVESWEPEEPGAVHKSIGPVIGW